MLEDLVKMADMGLLLGSPVLGNALEKIGAVLTEILSSVRFIYLLIVLVGTYIIIKYLHSALNS